MNLEPSSTAWYGSGALSKPHSQDPKDEKELFLIDWVQNCRAGTKIVPSYTLGDLLRFI